MNRVAATGAPLLVRCKQGEGWDEQRHVVDERLTPGCGEEDGACLAPIRFCG
ncbi:hypothetical protein [Streptomyces sp. CBMA156]|uniref:hypothetical protein n=1 Tax=Streptomyces sp. CBMA156 TaxID=1930280 RepID=UPI001661BA58|nr:hypothetical protein [Streptomyces sp. CBMA156]